MKIEEAAKKAGVSRETVRQWLLEGKIKPIGFCHLGCEKYAPEICAYTLNSYLASVKAPSFMKEENLIKVFNALVDGILVVATDLSVLYINEKLCSFFQLENKKVIGQKIDTTLFPIVYKETIEHHVEQIITGEKKVRKEFAEYSLIATPIKNDKGELTGILEHFRIK